MIGFERCTPETDEVEVETALRYGKDKFWVHVPYGYLKRHKDFEEVNVYLYKDDDPFAPMYLSQNMEANR
ncbi:hypothetical protein ABHI18_010865 [Aspergillus niger]